MFEYRAILSRVKFQIPVVGQYKPANTSPSRKQGMDKRVAAFSEIRSLIAVWMLRFNELRFQKRPGNDRFRTQPQAVLVLVINVRGTSTSTISLSTSTICVLKVLPRSRAKL